MRPFIVCLCVAAAALVSCRKTERAPAATVAPAPAPVAPVAPVTPVAPVAPVAPAPAPRVSPSKARVSPTDQCGRLVKKNKLSAKSKLAIVADAGWAPYFACIATTPPRDGTHAEVLFIVDGRTGKSVYDESHESSGSEDDGKWSKASVKVTPFALGPNMVAIRISVKTATGEDDRDQTLTTEVRIGRIGRIADNELEELITLESELEYGETTDSTSQKLVATKTIHKGYFELIKTTTASEQEYGGSFDTKDTSKVERLRWNGSAYVATPVK